MTGQPSETRIRCRRKEALLDGQAEDLGNERAPEKAGAPPPTAQGLQRPRLPLPMMREPPIGQPKQARYLMRAAARAPFPTQCIAGEPPLLARLENELAAAAIGRASGANAEAALGRPAGQPYAFRAEL